MNEKPWELLPQFGMIEKLLAEMQKSVDELAAQADLPDTVEATEFLLLGAMLDLNEALAKKEAIALRYEHLRIHFAKLRKAQLEAALVPAQPATETGEVSGQGPIPTPPDAETAVENKVAEAKEE